APSTAPRVRAGRGALPGVRLPWSEPGGRGGSAGRRAQRRCRRRSRLDVAVNEPDGDPASGAVHVVDLPDLPYDEAADAGPCLDGDLNHHWTAFGPTNVELHRGNAYIEPSDAGAAAERARRIDLGRIDVVERRAALLVDAGRAYAQWGKLE